VSAKYDVAHGLHPAALVHLASEPRARNLLADLEIADYVPTDDAAATQAAVDHLLDIVAAAFVIDA
jgi:hypothetical protein